MSVGGATLGDPSPAGISLLPHESALNVLETIAVSETIKHWTAQLSGKAVLVRTDSTTAVSYYRRQGGSHSPDRCFRLDTVEPLL